MMGWERKLRRAAVATRHDTRIGDPELLAELGAGERFSVTELERYGDCSSMWFVDRVLSPREIDFELDARMRGSIAHATLARFFTLLPAELAIERLSEDDLPAAYPLMRRCLAEALGGQRVPDSVAGKELGRALERDLDAFLRAEAELALPLVPRRFEVRFGGPMAAPGLKDGLRIGDFAVTGQIDRIDMDPGMSPRGLVWDYKSGASAHSAGEMERDGRLQIPLYILALRDLLGVEPLGGMYRALAGRRLGAWARARGRDRDRRPRPRRPARHRRVLGAGHPRHRGGGRRRRRHAGRPRGPRPAHGRVSRLVHAAHDLPGLAAVSADRWNPEQRAAVERRGHVFVAAGAGTGKTAVLVERVLAQVLGGTPIDRLLAITFTDRAASELRRRVREGLELAGEMERARAIDTAWISTIHRFCLRILRANAFDAGLDPRFAVADDVGSRLLRSEAFDIALERFLGQAPADDGGRRLDLLAAYGRRRLRETLSDVHEQLRSAGRPLELHPHAVSDLPAAVAAARAATAGCRPRAGGPARGPARRRRPVMRRSPTCRRTRSETRRRGRTTTPPARRSRPPRSTRRPSPTSACSGSSCACSTPPTPSARTTAAWSTSPTSSCARARSWSPGPIWPPATASGSPACSWTSSRTRTGCSAS